MAVSVSTGDMRINRPFGGPRPLSNDEKIVFVRLVVGGTYDGAGGWSVAPLMAALGMKYARQILPISHRSNDFGAGAKPASMFFSFASQKITFHNEGATGHVEAGGGQTVAGFDLDVIIIGR